MSEEAIKDYVDAQERLGVRAAVEVLPDRRLNIRIQGSTSGPYLPSDLEQMTRVLLQRKPEGR